MPIKHIHHIENKANDGTRIFAEVTEGHITQVTLFVPTTARQVAEVSLNASHVTLSNLHYVLDKTLAEIHEATK